MDTWSIEERVNHIFDLLDEYGQEEYGEAVTQLQHASQAAALAEAAGHGEEVMLAAFLHDIGHMAGREMTEERMGEFGVQSHDRLGGTFLRKMGFSEKVAFLVEGHVAAKRYLTFADPEYYEKLSEASKQTLVYQGGKMNPEEAATFRQHPWFDLCLEMRNWDDEAKLAGVPVPDLQPFREMAYRHLVAQEA